MLMGFMLNPYLLYVIAAVFIIALLGRLYYELYEYLMKRQCARQNLKYVRMPSQTIAIIRKQRYDIAETKFVKENGKVFGTNMLNQLTIYVADAELVQIVCNREFTKFTNRRVSIIYDH